LYLLLSVAYLGLVQLKVTTLVVESAAVATTAVLVEVNVTAVPFSYRGKSSTLLQAISNEKTPMVSKNILKIDFI
jgi:hypothetical protein